MTPSVFECCILNHGVFINCSKESIVMKKISFEKKMLGVMVILSLLSVFLFYIGMKGVEEAGGACKASEAFNLSCDRIFNTFATPV